MRRCQLKLCLLWIGLACCGCLGSRHATAVEFRGRIVDADSGEPLAARVYLQNAANEWLFVETDEAAGSAIPYREQWVPMPDAVELHTTVSAHVFRADLPAGVYRFAIERGKEYLPLRQQIEIGSADVRQTFRLQRWIDLSSRGWYSGETHVHRRIQELPNVMAAEDLNVAFPVTFWTVQSDAAPGLEPSPLRRQGPSPFGPREDHGYAPLWTDEQHVILPRNTEYEIFSVNGERHVLGAIFILNHRTAFTSTAPPVADIARQAHLEDALLDLDKHSWPWSMMLVPVAGVDLFELSNNSVWRTKFGFKRINYPAADWLQLEQDSPQSLTEWGWLNYGFEMYYALLNCGFRLVPSAGTASGVHPVPLGHSRVYVHTGEALELSNWLEGLRKGRSFVTTGPMLFVRVEGQLPGEDLQLTAGRPPRVRIEIESISAKPIDRLEILRSGHVVESIQPELSRTAAGAWQARETREIEIDETCWLAVRSVEPQPDGRRRFAHTAPWHVQLENQPLRPRRDQLQYFIALMDRELERNRGLLTTEALAEFEQARAAYQALLANAR